MEIAIVLSLLVVTIILFATDTFTVDVVTLIVLFVLIALKIITPAEGYQGFASDFIIMLAAIFVIGAAIEENGILEALGRQAVRKFGKNSLFLMVGMMMVSVVMSAFMNNTTLTALLIAPVMSISRHLKISASKLLMPIAFASLLGGTCTLIGTSTNVAGSAYLLSTGMQPLTMFELLPLGAVLSLVGIVYMVLFGRWLLPDRAKDEDVSLKERHYLTEVRILKSSPMVGQSVYKSDLYEMKFKIHRLVRGKTQIKIDSTVYIQTGDRLFVEGNVDNLLKVRRKEGVDIVGEHLSDEKQNPDKERQIAEVLVNKNSRLINETLRTNEFKKRWGLVALALHRPGKKDITEIKNIPLQMGDILLVQGGREDISYLASANNLIVVGEMRHKVNTTKRGWAAFAVFALAILLGTLNILPISVAFMAAAVACVLIKAIDTETAYRAIDWRLLVLIGGMTAFGLAMKNSGADVFLANLIAGAFQNHGPEAVMAGFMVLTVILTQPMSNAASALVVLPVAIQTALTMNVEPRSFAIAVIVSASISMITPFEPSCILVYGPGKYKFFDYVRVGGPLTLALLVIIWFLVPVYWPL